jgi:hypothetical protein
MFAESYCFHMTYFLFCLFYTTCAQCSRRHMQNAAALWARQLVSISRPCFVFTRNGGNLFAAFQKKKHRLLIMTSQSVSSQAANNKLFAGLPLAPPAAATGSRAIRLRLRRLLHGELRQTTIITRHPLFSLHDGFTPSPRSIERRWVSPPARSRSV